MKKTSILFLEYLGVSFTVAVFSIILLNFLNLNNLILNLAFWFLGGIGIALIICVIRRINDKWSLKDIGFRIHRSWGKDIWFGFIGFCLLYIVQLPIVIINLPYQADILSKNFNMFKEMPIYIMIPVATILAIIFGFITGAWHEEILYRGYLQGVFSKKIAPAMGFFISFIPFGITHHFSHPDYNLFLIFIVLINGAFFCLVYYATGSLLVSMTTHTLCNTLPIYAPLFYIRGYEIISYIVSVSIAVILLIFCFIGKKEVKELFNKTKEIYFQSRPIHSVMGIILGALIILITWGRNIFADYFDTGIRIVVYGFLGLGFLGVSMFNRKRARLGVIAFVLTGLSIFGYFGFHTLRIQLVNNKIHNKTLNQETKNRVKPVFNNLPDGWNMPMKQAMNNIWKSLSIKGINYFTFGKPKTVFSKYIERSNPRSRFYQSWFGIYIISGENKSFGIKNGEINISELGQLAEFDQQAWLKAMGDPNPEAKFIGNFTILDSFVIDGSKQTIYEGRMKTHSDLTEKNKTRLVQYLGMPPKQKCENKFTSYHTVTLKGIYGGWYNKQNEVTIVFYGCGVEKMETKEGEIKGQYHKIKPDLIEILKGISIKQITNGNKK